MDTYALQKLTGWTPELSPPPDSPLYRARPLAGEFAPAWRVASMKNDRDAPNARNVVPGRVEDANSDVQLHIGEPLDSGPGPSDHPGMTIVTNVAFKGEF
jgi:hypothetical protein